MGKIMAQKEGLEDLVRDFSSTWQYFPRATPSAIAASVQS